MGDKILTAAQRRACARLLPVLAGLGFLAAALPAQAEAAPRLFSAADVFELEVAADPQISPDGRSIAYVRRSMDRLADRPVGAIWTIDAATGRHEPLIADAGSVGAPRWSPTGDRIAYIGAHGGKPALMVRYLETGRSFSLAQLPEGPGAPVWSPDGTRLAFTMFEPAEPLKIAPGASAPEGAEWAAPSRVFDDIVFRADGAGYLEEGATHVYVIGAEGGTPRRVTEGLADFGEPAWLGNAALLVTGNDAADAHLDPIESEIYRVDLATLARTPLTTRDGPDTSPAVSPNGRQIATLGYDDRVLAYQQTDLWIMGADGAAPRNLTAGYDRDVASVRWAPDGSGLYALAEDRGDMVLVRIGLDGDVTELTRDVGGVVIGRPYSSGAFSVAAGDRGRPVVAYTQARIDRPADVGLLTGPGATRRLTDLNADALGHVELARIEELEVVSSHDGKAIQAWLAIPPGVEPDGTAPLLLEIHGGPFAMYGPTFAAEMQRYAAAGYVVLYVNPRGSTGYGEAFALEIDRAYPGYDAVDLVSAVDAALAQGWGDPERVFVTGGSGGGVLTAWLVGTTDRFRAAVSVKPVINWTTMALASDIAAFVRRHWLRADPWEDPDLYWRLSPISVAGNITTPTQVMVGEEDWRTPTWEAEQLYTALQLQGVPTRLVRIPGSAHDLSARPSQLNQSADAILDWFAMHGGPARPE